MTDADILRLAKGYIIHYGWCQGDHAAFAPDRACGYCAATAIQSDFDTSMRLVHLFKVANDVPDRVSIGDWNDAPERTIEDVLAAYDKAIAAADLMVTADELRAMPRSKCVLAFLRACRTFDEVGDIDGPWRDEAMVLLCAAAGIQDMKAYGEWERSHTKDEVLAAIDRAIAAAEMRA